MLFSRIEGRQLGRKGMKELGQRKLDHGTMEEEDGHRREGLLAPVHILRCARHKAPLADVLLSTCSDRSCRGWQQADCLSECSERIGSGRRRRSERKKLTRGREGRRKEEGQGRGE